MADSCLTASGAAVRFSVPPAAPTTHSSHFLPSAIMRLHTSVFLLASLTAILACGDDDDSPAGPLNTYRVVPGPALAIGQDTTVQASAVVRDETHSRDLTGAAATYTSADTMIATVSLTGLVKGIRPGTTNIIARFVDQTAQIPVTVRANPSGTVSLAAPASAATDFRY